MEASAAFTAGGIVCAKALAPAQEKIESSKIAAARVLIEAQLLMNKSKDQTERR
jgi:hypothetical protein